MRSVHGSTCLHVPCHRARCSQRVRTIFAQISCVARLRTANRHIWSKFHIVTPCHCDVKNVVPMSTVKLRVDAESAHPQNQNVRPKLCKKCTFLSLVVEVEETNTFTKLLNTPQSYLMPQKLFCAFEPMMRCCNRLSDSRFTLALQVIALTSVCGS